MAILVAFISLRALSRTPPNEMSSTRQPIARLRRAEIIRSPIKIQNLEIRQRRNVRAQFDIRYVTHTEVGLGLEGSTCRGRFKICISWLRHSHLVKQIACAVLPIPQMSLTRTGEAAVG